MSKLIILKKISHRFSSFLVVTAIVLSFQFSIIAQSAETITGDACTELSVVQTDFFDIDSYEVNYIETADVNNDGIPDVLVNLLNLGKISVQLGDGKGGLLPANEFKTGGFPSDFELADINRDGELDILAVNETNDQIALLLGDGNGNFTLTQSIDMGFRPKLIKVGNFDHDPYLDFVIAYGNSLTIYSGNRNLTFTEKGSLTTPFSPGKIEVSDLNGDQISDVVGEFFNSGEEKVQVFIGQANGSLTLSINIEDINAETLAVGDVNNDGFADFLTAERFNADYTIFTFLGNGDGTFQSRISSNATFLNELQLFDMNLDGNLDAVTNSGAVLIGNGNGNFMPFQNASTSNFAREGGFGDFNSDEFPDFIFTNQNRTGIHINNGDGSFRDVPNSSEFQLSRPTEVNSADFNLDGKDDFLVLNAQNNRVFVFIQSENGQFVPTPSEGIQVGGGFNVSPFSSNIADFNNDNVPDFVVADAFSRQIVVFTGNGNATFEISRFNTSGPFAYIPRVVRSGDFNNDNFTDIIVTTTSGSYMVFLNDGDGGFTRLAPVDIGSSTQLRLIAVGDINNDGILDFVTGRIDLGELRFAIGNGDGTFVTSSFPINGVGSLAGIILEDLNGDGNLDLIIGGSSIMVSFGVGNGGFFDTVLYNYEGTINDLEFFDFDGDGIKDIVASGGPFPFGAIFILKGTGSGQFEQPFALEQFAYPQNIAPGDFNSDGKPDLIVLSGFVVKVLINDTNNLPCISVGNAQATEQPGGSTLTFNVSLSRPSTESISVAYKTVNRTAKRGADFAPVSGALVFQSGTTTQSITVNAVDDGLDENDETLTLTLYDASNAKLLDSVGVGTINDNDNPPAFLIGDSISIVEGSGPLSIGLGKIVSLSEPSGRKVKVRVSTQDITAAAGEDYEAFSEFIYFNPGDTLQHITIKPVADYRVEPDETFDINVSEPVNVVLANDRLNVTILNDDIGGQVQFAVSDISISESGKIAEISIIRTGGNASDVGVEFVTTNGTATGGSDYQNTSGIMVFDANETTKTIFVPIIDDSLNEDTENFSLSLQNVTGGGTIGTNSIQTVSISDNDPLPRLRISNSSINEGSNGGKTILNFSINLLEPSGRNVSVNFATQDGTAASPTDYISTNGTVNFKAGETSKTIQLMISADNDVEPDETFSLIISSPTNAEITGGNAVVTIINDDLPSNATVPFDFDGDNKTDISIFRPSLGQWWIRRSSDSIVPAFPFGVSTDKIVPADYTGDGKTDVAFWRESTAQWFILRSEDSNFYAFPFGAAGDIPTPADFDGDGKSDAAVFRPSNSTWYILNSSDNSTTITTFGTLGDLPVAADYDGDGKADIGIYRPSNGQWWINRSSAGLFVTAFGVSTDKAVPADYTGDGKTDIAFFRPSTGFWYILRSEDTQFYAFPFGTGGDTPAPGDYDGDGRADAAVFRNSNTTWYLQQSTSGLGIVGFGANGDIPLPNAFVR